MTVGGERILEGWMAAEAGGDEDDETRGFGAAMMGGGRVSGIEIPLVDTVYGNFPDDPPTAIITATSTGKGRRGVEEDSHPNIEYADAVGLPEGWKHRRLPRKDKSHSDPYWYSPMMNYKFNSIPKVRRFLDHMEDANGDEVMAYETMHPSARRRSGGGGVGGKGGGKSPSSGVVIVVNDSTNDSDDDYGNKRRRGGKGAFVSSPPAPPAATSVAPSNRPSSPGDPPDTMGASREDRTNRHNSARDVDDDVGPSIMGEGTSGGAIASSSNGCDVIDAGRAMDESASAALAIVVAASGIESKGTRGGTSAKGGRRKSSTAAAPVPPTTTATTDDDDSTPVLCNVIPTAAVVNGATLSDEDVIDANRRLLDAIASGDYESYRDLTSRDMTSIEPETLGQIVQGMDFHRYYFELMKRRRNAVHPPAIHMISPCVRWLGGGGGSPCVAAILSYVRLDQIVEDGRPVTRTTSETRIWENRDGRLVQVHFHKS